MTGQDSWELRNPACSAALVIQIRLTCLYHYLKVSRHTSIWGTDMLGTRKCKGAETFFCPALESCSLEPIFHPVSIRILSYHSSCQTRGDLRASPLNEEFCLVAAFFLLIGRNSARICWPRGTVRLHLLCTNPSTVKNSHIYVYGMQLSRFLIL